MSDEKRPPSEEELEELMETIKKLEEERKKQQKKRPKGLLVIEFGGVYHLNPIVNFLFSLLINITLALIIVELFGFATYDNAWIFVGFIATYSVIEGIVKHYVTIHYLQYIIKTFGFILYLLYLVIFYVVDQYIFIEGLFDFKQEYYIVSFVTLFVLIRYFIGTSIRRSLRNAR